MPEGLPGHPFGQATVAQLLGADRFHQRDRVRGIYCTLPSGDMERKPRHVHIDDGQSTLGVLCYVDRVDPDGGIFAVWPSCHKKLFYTSHSRYRREYTDDFEKVRHDYDDTWETSSMQTYWDPATLFHGTTGWRTWLPPATRQPFIKQS